MTALEESKINSNGIWISKVQNEKHIIKINYLSGSSYFLDYAIQTLGNNQVIDVNHSCIMGNA